MERFGNAEDRTGPISRAPRYIDGLADCGQLFGLVVGDVQLELVLELHDELDGVQGVRAEIIDEGRVFRDLLLTDAQLVRNDRPDLLEEFVSFRCPLE
jgi:hypothetical protein